MDRRLARALTTIYSAVWRERYGEEFAAFLEDHPSTFKAVLNVVFCGLQDRLAAGGGAAMDPRQRSLALMAWSYLATVAAGVNFYWILDDTAVIDAMRSHSWFAGSHKLIAFGSLVAFAAVISIALPVAVSISRTALTGRRWDVVLRIAVPLGAAAVTLAWLAAATSWAHARWGALWVPTPWDVNWALQPAGWPPLSVRLVLSSVTFALLVLGWVVSGVSVAQAIHRTDLSSHDVWLKVTATVLTAATLAMTGGMAVWGWLAERYASDAFRAGAGLILDVSMAHAWLVSTIVFALSSALALKASRSAFEHA